RYDVYAVPSIAVTEGLKGPQVFVLDDEGKTETRFVSLGEIAGDWQIITEGLNPGDRVVVSGIGSISPGDQIDAQPFTGKVPKPQNNAGENPSQEPDAQGGEGVAGAQRDAQKANGGQNGAN
ncbi:MAG: efflux transporter periplasmic adaptor subunit, partial [Pseudomonadota bacterium]|nr:efflux transporter periplasmic adaptor subunit [Pseudomonadota bacterium]